MQEKGHGYKSSFAIIQRTQEISAIIHIHGLDIIAS